MCLFDFSVYVLFIRDFIVLAPFSDNKLYKYK